MVEKDVNTIPRLPIDRVFSLSGFGTIITGTLLAGTISKEDNLQVYPIGKECKIRNIQVHGQDVEKCYAGQRVAINLSNVKKSELRRGCVLAPPNNMKNTMLLDVKLNVLPSSMRVLTNHTRLHLFTGTSEILCRAVLLDKEEIALRRGDKFVVRFYSPMETIGGGIVLEPNPKKKKRFDKDAIEELQKKESGSSEDVIELHVKSHEETMITVTELAKLTALSMEEVTEDVQSLEQQGIVKVFRMKKDTYVWHTIHEQNMRHRLTEALCGYHEKYPYRYGMKKAEIHMTYMKKVKLNVFDLYVEMLSEEGALKRHQEFLQLPEFEVRKDSVYEKVLKTVQKQFEKVQFDFQRFSEISFGNIKREEVEDIMLLLIDEVRDLLGTSRKSAKPILEYMDSIKVTKKNGTESERVAYV